MSYSPVRSAFITLVLCLCAAEAGTQDSQHAVRIEMFPPGVSSDSDVFRGTFSPDGRTFYFFKKVRADAEDYRIFVSRLGGGWSVPERLALGGEHSDTYPTLSRDGRWLVFASSRPAPVAGFAPNFYLWIAERQGDGWGAPRFLDALNLSDHYHSWPTLVGEGALHFRRITPDWQTTVSLVAPIANGTPGAATPDPVIERCRTSVPTQRVAGGLPGPRPGLYFLDVVVPRGEQTPAHSDIWSCHQTAGGAWTARPLGPEIKTAAFETFPFFSPDASYLYFVRAFRTTYRVPLAAAIRE